MALKRRPVVEPASMNKTLVLTGTVPLIMHNVQAVDPLNEYAKAMKEIVSKTARRRTEADLAELDHLMWLSGLYYDPVEGPYLPGHNLMGALYEAAKATRSGKKVEQGVIVLTERAPLIYEGPRDLETLWGGGQSIYADRRIVNKNPSAGKSSKVVGVRPIFPSWSAMFEVVVDDEVLSKDEFESILARAGRVGIGDYRRIYGKFRVEVS